MKNSSRNEWYKLDNLKNYLIPLFVIILLFFLLKVQLVKFFNWITGIFSSKDTPQSDSQIVINGTKTKSELNDIYGILIQKFNSFFGTSNSYLTLLNGLNKYDFYYLSDKFGVKYFSTLDGSLSDEDTLLSWFTDTVYLKDMFKKMLDEESFNKLNLQFNSALT